MITVEVIGLIILPMSKTVELNADRRRCYRLQTDLLHVVGCIF